MAKTSEAGMKKRQIELIEALIDLKIRQHALKETFGSMLEGQTKDHIDYVRKTLLLSAEADEVQA
jgi:hypothetical protein